MKETWDKTMDSSSGANQCARAEDLVSYLYNEATPDEARDFEKHVRHCASCDAELAAFGGVRQAINGWRQQALGSLTSPAFETARAFAPARASSRKRSALAALREFFTLSPAWMRAATAAAAIMFCALAVIAVAYFVQKPQTVIVEKPIKSGHSDEEVERMIAEALKREKESRASEAPVPSPETVKVANNERPKAPPQLERRASDTLQTANNPRRRPSVQQPGARTSTELASTDYLPFTASVDEETPPSLADLVDDANEE